MTHCFGAMDQALQILHPAPNA